MDDQKPAGQVTGDLQVDSCRALGPVSSQFLTSESQTQFAGQKYQSWLLLQEGFYRFSFIQRALCNVFDNICDVSSIYCSAGLFRTIQY